MRAVVTGENQFELYSSLEAAASSMELPEVKSGQYLIFDELGRKYGFEIFDQREIPVGTFKLRVLEDDVFLELLSIYSAWVKHNKLPNMPIADHKLFDGLEKQWGLQ